MKDAAEMFFDVLANKYRFKILRLLLEKPMSVNELAVKIGIDQSHTSYSLKCLFDCRFVNAEVIGHTHKYRVNDEIKPLIISTIKYVDRYKEYLTACGLIKSTK